MAMPHRSPPPAERTSRAGPTPASRPNPAAEDVVLRTAARSAEDCGDFSGALRLVAQLPCGPERSAWLRSLREVLALGDAPAPHQLGRWLVQPALRFGLRPACAPVFTGFALEVLRAWGLPGVERTRLAPARAAADPIVADAGLFDGGVFDRYLADALAAPLREAAGPLETWSRCPASAFEVRSSAPDCLQVADLHTGRAVQVVPEAVLEVGALCYGRLVPTGEPEREMFVLPPVAIDQVTAGRVVRAVSRAAPVAERLRAVASYQRRTGEQPAPRDDSEQPSPSCSRNPATP